MNFVDMKIGVDVAVLSVFVLSTYIQLERRLSRIEGYLKGANLKRLRKLNKRN